MNKSEDLLTSRQNVESEGAAESGWKEKKSNSPRRSRAK